jgi:ABC-2 type transport system ATP-binding protein
MNNKEDLPIIVADTISKAFGKHVVLDCVSLSIHGGTVYGLVGLNGAGKTTVLRLLLGLLSPDNGSTSILTKTSQSKREQIYRRCGVVLDHDGFWGNMTILENLKFYSDAKGLERDELNNYLVENWEETGLLKITKKVKHLSRGQKMQCALCRAFMGNPEVLFLDEPVIALDIHAYSHFCTMIRKAQERNAAIIISSHQLELVDELCDRVGFLNDKKLTEIRRQSTPMWKVRADNKDEYRCILEQCGAVNITYHDGWNFMIENVDNIPTIVSMLVGAGCKIHGVFQTGNAFSSAIRTLAGPSESRV